MKCKILFGEGLEILPIAVTGLLILCGDPGFTRVFISFAAWRLGNIRLKYQQATKVLGTLRFSVIFISTDQWLVMKIVTLGYMVHEPTRTPTRNVWDTEGWLAIVKGTWIADLFYVRKYIERHSMRTVDIVYNVTGLSPSMGKIVK